MRALTLACTPYDRMLPLFLGEVTIEGIALKPIAMYEPVAIFRGMIRDRAFDIAEMSLGQCFEQAASGASPFVALPVFPSRGFRHGFVFVNRHSGIARPADLAGKRIGVQHHGMSAAVWIRQMLRADHGVDFADVTWVEAPVNSLAGDHKVAGPSPAPGLTIETVTDRTLSDMLADGAIDAMIGAWVPDSYRANEAVVRLFPDHRAVEQDYYRRTGLFPAMHALVIRADLHAEEPTLARRVFDACNAAKAMAMRHHRITGALSTMLPWLYDDLDEIDRVFGEDYWPYGLTRNRAMLQAFADTLVEEGALSNAPVLDEVFLSLD